MLGAVPCWPTLLAGLLGVGLPTAAFAQLEHPLVGAIRWDAWHGELEAPGLAVERALAPLQYRSRLPWFTEFREDGTPSIRCDRPGVIEAEIQYALEAGIDYWAFVTYPEESALSIPLRQYLGGEWEAAPRFCSIFEWSRFGGPDHYQPVVERLLGYFADPRYVRVLGDRPLLYLLCHGDEHVTAQWGSVDGLRVAVDALRAGAAERGLGDPYIVVTWFHASEAEAMRQSLGADALSAYAVPGGTPEGVPFEQSQAQARTYWEQMAAVGPMIPIVSWGWDQRPRVDNPPPWVPNPTPHHYETFTPDQCAEALEAALDWVAEHSDACPANAVLCYAWNEHDEGGWLCPTLGSDGQPDDSRVRAVGEMLARRRAGL
jgi:hypothetical protein